MTPTLLHIASSFAASLEDLAPALANHLWQTTAFACAAGLLTLAVRRNAARIRFGVWLAASLKFLVPFALLAAIGSHLARPRPVTAPAQALVYTVQDFTAPFDLRTPLPPAPQRPALPTRDLLTLAAALGWLAGTLAVLTLWTARYVRISRTLRGAPHLEETSDDAARPLPGAPFMARSGMSGVNNADASIRLVPILRRLEAAAGIRPMQVRVTRSTLEPGVFGIFRPTLAWPAGLIDHLTDAQLEAILAHEVAHIRRRDNLCAALHMLVEAAFWFHPLVWFVGARLLAERERACDEAVAQLCPEPDAYAEGILKVCEFCIESPLACVSGITGADLKHRITHIMTGRAMLDLSRAKKAALVCAAVLAVAAPITFGLNNPARIFAAADMLAWEKAAGGHQEFEVASVREDKRGGPANGNFTLDGNGNAYWVMDKNTATAPGGNLFRATNTPLMRYIIFAYKLGGTQELALRMQFWAGLKMNVPAWLNETLYDIDARAAGPATKDQMRLMMQSLLAERFHLGVHWETRQAPVFAMTLDKPGALGPQLHAHPASDSCSTTVYRDGAAAAVDRGGATAAVPANTAAVETQVLPIPCGMIARLPASAPGRHRIGGRNVTLAMLAESLPAQTGVATFPKPVIDRTGLGGTFDFTLEWTPPAPVAVNEMAPGPTEQGEVPGPSIGQAIKEQLGIRLESSKGPVELLVIDRVEKPSADDAQMQAPSAAVPSMTPVAQIQQAPPPADTPEHLRYEIVSIRPADPNLPQGTSLRFNDDGFQARGVPFEVLVRVAYHLGFVEGAVEGVPDWAHKGGFDIEARVADSDVPEHTRIVHDFTPAGEARRDAVLRNLLADHFHFRAHLATKEGTIYALVVAKGGPKLQPGSDTDQSSIFLRPRGHMQVKNATLSAVAPALAQELGHTVVDKTGLSGKCTFTLTWTPDRGASASPDQSTAPDTPPSLFTALQEQLGLKLEPQKGPVQYLVIDSADKPSLDSAAAPSSTPTLLRVAQTQPADAPKPLAFEVVSIRENKSGDAQHRLEATADGWHMTNVPFEAVLQLAFAPKPGGPAFFSSGALVGAPDWTHDRYDIDAKVPQSEMAEWQKSAQQPVILRAMLQNMLVDRCKLAVHRDSKVISLLALEVAKGGPKLKPADPNAPLPNSPVKVAGLGSIVPEDGGKSLHFYGANMALFVNLLSRGGQSPIQDHTGLTDRYEFVVHLPEPPASAPGDAAAQPDPRDLAEAVAEQLGLKLVPAKGQVETLVIDHIDRPTEN